MVKVEVSKSPFVLWTYEKRLIGKSLPFLVLALLMISCKVLLSPSTTTTMFSWSLAAFFVGPFLVLAIGALFDKGDPAVTWDVPWQAISRLRLWFWAQYSIIFTTFALYSFLYGSWFLVLGFLVYIPIFFFYSWALESRIFITKKGVATRMGVLKWDWLSKVTIYPKDKVVVLEIRSFIRHFLPYALYWLSDPNEVEGALKKIL